LADDNNLVGYVPDEIQAVVEVETIELFKNGLSGSIPTTLASLSSLTVWDVEQNSLTGPAFVAVPPSLEAYRVSTNRLTGPLPDWSAMANLKQLWAATNEITGTIPSSFGSMTSLGTSGEL